MKLLHENFRRFVENKKQLTLDDVETLVKLARMFRAGNLQQAFATADAVGLLDGFLDVLFYGTTNKIIDVLGGAEEAGELDEEEASEMFEVLDLGPGYASTQRKMRDFLGSPAAAQDEALMNKILDMTNETFNSKGVPGLTSGGWVGTFETKMIIAMIRNPAQSENILKRIVKLASEWKPNAGSAGVRRYLWNIITRLDSEHSGLKVNPNVTNAPEGPVAKAGPGFREPNGHFSVGSKIINPEWVKWANS
jgi:hypothetical protein